MIRNVISDLKIVFAGRAVKACPIKKNVRHPPKGGIGRYELLKDAPRRGGVHLRPRKKGGGKLHPCAI